jgi:glycosyltransferase involved in cell wall biosynthesis
MGDESYCLLTACKNEVKFIGDTIRSVTGQSLRPRLWIILDDGSNDGTAELVQQLSQGHDWIQLHLLGPRRERSFGAQYRAIMRGYEMLGNVSFGFIGALDADISLESPDYFKRIMREFRENPRLGITGGVICEAECGVFLERRGNADWSVAGAVQMFRREVFEAIAGYTPLEYGGSDTLAVLSAQMRGWEVWPVADLKVFHHRPTCGANGRLRGAFRQGIMDAAYGYDPLFAMLKYLRRLTFKPCGVGSLLSLAGYCSYRLNGRKPVMPDHARRYLRKAQWQRVFDTIPLNRTGAGVDRR